jgi:hypothetical protein
MSIQEAAPRPDVTDLIAVHRVFRDTLADAPVLVGGATSEDTARVQLIANYYDNILRFLQVHHDGEEALVFPKLRERCPGKQEVIDSLESQHEEIVRLLENAERSIAAWPGGGAAEQLEVTDSLEALRMQLVVHLNEEEGTALELCADNLTPEEWGALPGHGMANFTGDKIWLIMGLIRERLTDEQRVEMIEHMPPPAVEMWTGFGERAFKELSAQVADGAA